MSGNILRNWFVPKDGINRQVISADIQKYLGNDATVRPGKDAINGKEVEGYWIKAYRNLTTEMINDLRLASQKWDQEQRSGRRGNYEDSHTYRSASNGYRAGTSSPQLDGAYAAPPARAGMPPPEMAPYADPRVMYAPHSGPPVTTAFVEPSMYVSHPPRQTPVGYGPQGEFFAPAPAYGHDVASSHVRNSPQYPPQYSSGHRDPRDDPRYAPEYQDPVRYAYPSGSAAPNGGASSPPQPTSNYPPPMRYDQYGRPYSQAPIPDQSYPRPSPSVDSSYHSRERPSAPPGGDARRRRIG